jgi:putative transposase
MGESRPGAGLRPCPSLPGIPVRSTMGNVKRWQDGSMKKRWVAAGMLEAERNFRRLRGCAAMPILVAALARATASEAARYDEDVA